MPKFQYIGEPFSREKPGTICEFMEYDAVEMRAKSTNDWQELPNDYVAPKVDVIAQKLKNQETAIANEPIVTGVEPTMVSTNENKPKPLPAFTKEQVEKRTLSPEHLAKLKAGRDAKRAE